MYHPELDKGLWTRNKFRLTISLHFDFSIKIDMFLAKKTCLNCRAYDSVYIPDKISYLKILTKKLYLLITPDLLEDIV
jgi:hypothetical protein